MMKLWVPAAVGVLVVAAYFIFYAISATESQGSTSLGFANVAGLAAGVVGLLGAWFILRRGPPADKTF